MGGDERDGAERGQRNDDVRQLREALEEEDTGWSGAGVYVRVYGAERSDGKSADGDVGDGECGAVEAHDAGRVRAGDAGRERKRAHDESAGIAGGHGVRTLRVLAVGEG